MGFFGSIFGALGLLLFGGIGDDGRSHRGLFGGIRSSLDPPASGSSKSGWGDPYDRKFRKILRHGIFGAAKPEKTFGSTWGPDMFPKSGGKNLPKDHWDSKAREFGIGLWPRTGSTSRRNPMTSGYYGHRGEFDNNDRFLAHLEDMQEMSQDPGFKAEEQGYDWDEIMDAMSEGYISKENSSLDDNCQE